DFVAVARCLRDQRQRHEPQVALDQHPARAHVVGIHAAAMASAKPKPAETSASMASGSPSIRSTMSMHFSIFSSKFRYIFRYIITRHITRYIFGAPKPCRFVRWRRAAHADYNERMFAPFFHKLKQAGLPVTLREYLTLMEAMEQDLAGRRVEDFYYLSRAALVKDERNLDKFDRVFGHVFRGLDLVEQALEAEIPAE